MSNFELAKHLFLQLAVILFVCRCTAYIGTKYLKQPEVVCEMIAGVLLGPSVLGLTFPEIKNWLFPGTFVLPNGSTITHSSMAILYALSHVGLVLYMFLVGLDFNLDFANGKLKKITIISSAGIIAPFLLGIFCAFFLYSKFGLFQPHVEIGPMALYLGAAISITAFPTLARILHERKINKTNIGSLSLAAGSIDDAVAWCLVAIILSVMKGNFFIAATTITGGVLYVLFFLFVGNSVLKIVFRAVSFFDSKVLFIFVLILIMLGAWITDAIGIYSVFGAYIVGVCIPRGNLSVSLKDKLEPLTTSLLLPVFFVYSGLNTSIRLLNNASLWAVVLLIIVIAIIGKGLFCTLAARTTGENWKDSLCIGILMNCRGLMELIILNIGLEYNIITPTFFTIGVIMALVTTLMTSPLFDFVYKKKCIEKSV